MWLVKFLTYNIHSGVGVDGRLDLERIAGVIRDSEADLVALQEVDRCTMRSENLDMPQLLEQYTGLQVFFEKTMDYDDGQYGNALLSRLPIISHQAHSLPGLPCQEPRNLLEVQIDTDGGPLSVLCTHFCVWHAEHRRASARFINERFVNADSETPLVLMGDLNARPGGETLQTLEEHWQNVAQDEMLTFPSKEPKWQIDHVYLRGAGHFNIRDVRVLDEPVASDHLPLLLDLEISPIK